MEDWELEQVKLAAARDSWEDDEEVADSWDAEEEVEEQVVEEQKKKNEVKAVKNITPVVAASNSKKNISTSVVVEESEQTRKERMNRLIQESDLENAMALFGISKDEINVEEVLDITKVVKKPASSSVNVETGLFESSNPQTWNEFETLSTTILKKLKSLDSSKHYPNFLEGLVRNLLLDRDVPEIRKISNMAAELVQSKQRDKLASKKKPAPSLVGASKKSGRADMMDFGDGADDDFDGF